MKTSLILMVAALAFGGMFVGSASANELVPDSTVMGSAQYPNINTNWGYQRYAGDGDDFAHAWFGVFTTYQVNNVQWVWWPTTDPTQWSASLLIWGNKTVGGSTWASSNDLYVGDVEVFEGHINDWSYSRNRLSADVEVWSPTAEFTSMTSSYTEVAPDFSRFLVRYNMSGDFLAPPVPEPATICLLVLGGLGLITRRRNRNRK